MGLIASQMLAGLGASIAIFDLNPTEISEQAVTSARRSADQRVARYKINVADREMVMTTVGLAVAEFGPPDIVINMAGIGGAAAFVDMPYEVFDRIVRVNLYGTRNVVEAVLPSMLARGSGDIVLVGSMGGIVAVYGYTAYGGSKFGVVGLAKCLRYELKPRGIRVACFCPGEVETPGLAEERKSLPPAAVALKKIGGTMPIDTAVRGLIEGIQRNQFMIIPGLKVKLTYWMHRLAPDWLWNAATDAIVANALRGTKQACSQNAARGPDLCGTPGKIR